MKLIGNVIEHIFLDNFTHGIVHGTLAVTTPEGKSYRFTQGNPGSEASWHIHDWKTIRLAASRGDIGLGEAYEMGLWDSPDLEALFRVFIDNLDHLEGIAHGNAFSKLWFRLLNHVLRRNNVKGSQSNIHAHYDVGNAFYKLWLDPSMTYSSALYQGTDSLESAQQAKYRRILSRITDARKSVLEVGCGWGGFAEEAAQHGHKLTGLTVSREQHDFATRRLNGKADIRLEDYRHTRGTFEAIASIEMFEAVGKHYWPAYFSMIKERLARDGVAMIQTITVKDSAFDDYEKRSDYIRHYVFPGGLLPSMTRFKEAAQHAGLACRDAFGFGQDYARTLREWLRRFDASEGAIRALGHDSRFIRSWRLYLAMCAASFAVSRTDVMQLELVHA